MTNEIENVETRPSKALVSNTSKSYLLYGVIAAAGLLVVAAFLFTRGYLVAATVNGQPISRLAVISKLEEQDGKKTLEAMVNERVLNAEFEKLGITVEASAVTEKITEIESQISAQGGTLVEALTQQGMTMETLEAQILSRLKLEKALGDKVEVTDGEVTAYIAENDIEIPDGEAADTFTAEIKDQLKQQKMQAEAQAWIAAVTDKAKIKYYVTY